MKIVLIAPILNLSFLFSFFFSASVLFPHSGHTGVLQCQMIPSLMSRFLARHIQEKRLSEDIQKRTAENYLDRIDPSNILFLKSEADAIQLRVRNVFKTMMSGDCRALVETHQKLVKRSNEFQNFVSKVVSKSDYKIDDTALLSTDSDKRGHPKTQEEQYKWLMGLIHFQMSNYVDSGTELKEAKRLLIHRYELRTKRVKNDDQEELMASFLDSFATALDPHSSYFSSDYLEEFNISMELSLEGIGVSLSSRDGYTIVEEIIPGGATDRVKALEPKDKIVAVAQQGAKPVDIIDMELSEVVKMIRGKKGTPVTLTIMRGEGEDLKRLDTTIVRDKIDLKEQAAKLEFEEVERNGKKLKLGVIQLPSFYGGRGKGKRSSYRDVKMLLEKAAKKDVDGLLLDLSKNSGGLLDDSVKISGLFIKTGGIVAAQVPAIGTEVYPDRNPNITYSGPLVILLSRLSASASEILAGAMKAYGRAIIVGDDHSFGKGTVQTVEQLAPGLGAVKVTTGMYFLPDGHSTQHTGVTSDILVPSYFSTERFGEKSLDFSLGPSKISSFVGGKANAVIESERWKPLDRSILKGLSQKSKKRVDSSDDFKEIREKLEEAKDKKEFVKLSDLRKDKDKNEALEKKKEKSPLKKKVEQKVSNKKKDEKTPQYLEALQILADYVTIG